MNISKLNKNNTIMFIEQNSGSVKRMDAILGKQRGKVKLPQYNSCD